MKNTMIFFRIFFVSFLWLLVSACSASDADTPPKSSVSKVDLRIVPPTTYCEKVWSCSYEELLSDEAKTAMVQKRKAFISSCEEALRKMPGNFIQKYEHCASKPCGEELRQCLLDAKMPSEATSR